MIKIQMRYGDEQGTAYSVDNIPREQRLVTTVGTIEHRSMADVTSHYVVSTA